MIYPLSAFLDNGENELLVKKLIAEFSSPKNKDVELFLRQKAIDFERTHNARTYLITNAKMEIQAYFSLSFKEIMVNADKMSKSEIKKLDGFNKNAKRIRVFLIGQIGKNANLVDNPVNLKDIFAQIFHYLLSAREIIGGRAVILECQPIEKLLNLYHQHGFKQLAVLDDDEMKTLYHVL
ncbi:acetyltransferase [Moraxella sp. ZY210820]|uniref:acetyltransferase n=1 Tax=unclassified Moraxella TaxID=2685852 RepID=UPI0027313752|nr:acetyltransferase [Moraxella sp. ZY210820]WLF83538.1 acetyltransferase [Moraxella sp. ZY210820]